jgi:hypothetical protein
MVRGAALASLLAVLAFGAAACGGGGSNKSSSTFSLSSTKDCLEGKGYTTAELKNQYLPGTEGNLRVHLAKKGPKLLTPGRPTGRLADAYVFLVFDKDHAAAVQTQDKALALAVESLREGGVQSTKAIVKKGVGLTKNVFYYSAGGALTSAQRSAVASCLR